MKIEYKEHFELSSAELEERIEQFERQYFEALLLNNDVPPELKIYLNYIKEEIESINGILKSLHEPKALYFRKYLSNEIKRHIDNIHSGRNQAEVNNCFIDMHIIITTDGVDYETFSATASKLMNHLNQLIEG